MNDTSPFFEKGSNERRDNFVPERFIKFEDDVEKCEQLLMQNFKFIQSFYLEGLTYSFKFPEIDNQAVQQVTKKLLDVFNKDA